MGTTLYFSSFLVTYNYSQIVWNDRERDTLTEGMLCLSKSEVGQNESLPKKWHMSFTEIGVSYVNPALCWCDAGVQQADEGVIIVRVKGQGYSHDWSFLRYHQDLISLLNLSLLWPVGPQFQCPLTAGCLPLSQQSPVLLTWLTFADSFALNLYASQTSQDANRITLDANTASTSPFWIFYSLAVPPLYMRSSTRMLSKFHWAWRDNLWMGMPHEKKCEV